MFPWFMFCKSTSIGLLHFPLIQSPRMATVIFLEFTKAFFPYPSVSGCNITQFSEVVSVSALAIFHPCSFATRAQIVLTDKVQSFKFAEHEPHMDVSVYGTEEYFPHHEEVQTEQCVKSDQERGCGKRRQCSAPKPVDEVADKLIRNHSCPLPNGCRNQIAWLPENVQGPAENIRQPRFYGP
ncbi:hypothetical protein [Desulfovibrio piger]